MNRFGFEWGLLGFQSPSFWLSDKIVLKNEYTVIAQSLKGVTLIYR